MSPACVGAVSMVRSDAARIRASQTGRSERTVGIERKLCFGGGEVVAHSSELASHGSSAAFAERRSVSTMLTRKIRTLTPISHDPIVEIRFMSAQPGLAG